MENRKTLILLTISLLSIVVLSCKKDENVNQKTLEQLYKTYKNGEISECKYNGHTVYSAVINAFDAGSVVYDKDGNRMGSCNHAWGQVDSICGQLINCEVVYRVKDNIWGQPSVDKYKFGE